MKRKKAKPVVAWIAIVNGEMSRAGDGTPLVYSTLKECRRDYHPYDFDSLRFACVRITEL